jgi:spermidine synthase
VSRDFEELDYRETPMGALSLRRRRLLSLGGREIYEVKLGEAFLMSSLFHEAEVALADLVLAELGAGSWDVVVGGLGLGYTVRAALRNPAVRSVVIVEALEGVIDWHRQGMVPLGKELMADPRCRFVQADFFALAKSDEGFDPSHAGRHFDAVLLDIDHSPVNLLHPRHADFYTAEGLQSMARHLETEGVFGQWSDGQSDEKFLRVLETTFESSRAELVKFDNPLLDRESASTVYLARKARPTLNSRGR